MKPSPELSHFIQPTSKPVAVPSNIETYVSSKIQQHPSRNGQLDESASKLFRPCKKFQQPTTERGTKKHITLLPNYPTKEMKKREKKTGPQLDTECIESWDAHGHILDGHAPRSRASLAQVRSRLGWKDGSARFESKSRDATQRPLTHVDGWVSATSHTHSHSHILAYQSCHSTLFHRL